nr:immunoglobulin light chain junction region [Macaca mulatta]
EYYCQVWDMTSDHPSF